MRVIVSIIVPIYNAEKYISRCIESLINQTFKDIEIILINDGSLDKSREICEKYSKKDPRIKLINKTNGGVSTARNLGIDIANGTYIYFIDPDDFIDKDAIEYLVVLINKYNADIACYKMRTYINNKAKLDEEKDEKIEVYIEENIISSQVTTRKFLCACCNKLYRRRLFNGENDRFDESINYAEDALFNVYMLSKAHKLVSSNLKKYNYYINEGSTVNKITIKRIDILKAQRLMYLYLSENHSNYTKYIISQYINSSIMIVADIANSSSIYNYMYILKKLKEEVNEDKWLRDYYQELDINNRIKFYILKKSPMYLLILYKLINTLKRSKRS